VYSVLPMTSWYQWARIKHDVMFRRASPVGGRLSVRQLQCLVGFVGMRRRDKVCYLRLTCCGFTAQHIVVQLFCATNPQQIEPVECEHRATLRDDGTETNARTTDRTDDDVNDANADCRSIVIITTSSYHSPTTHHAARVLVVVMRLSVSS